MWDAGARDGPEGSEASRQWTYHGAGSLNSQEPPVAQDPESLAKTTVPELPPFVVPTHPTLEAFLPSLFRKTSGKSLRSPLEPGGINRRLPTSKAAPSNPCTNHCLGDPEKHPANGLLGSQRVASPKTQPPHPHESRWEPEKVVRGLIGGDRWKRGAPGAGSRPPPSSISGSSGCGAKTRSPVKAGCSAQGGAGARLPR